MSRIAASPIPLLLLNPTRADGSATPRSFALFVKKGLFWSTEQSDDCDLESGWWCSLYLSLLQSQRRICNQDRAGTFHGRLLFQTRFSQRKGTPDQGTFRAAPSRIRLRRSTIFLIRRIGFPWSTARYPRSSNMASREWRRHAVPATLCRGSVIPSPPILLV